MQTNKEITNITTEYVVTLDNEPTDHSYDTYADSFEHALECKKQNHFATVVIVLQATGWDKDGTPETIDMIDLIEIVDPSEL